jgi:ATP-dependent DNA helicase RecG
MGNKVSNDAKVRINTMVRTNNGFEIADVDLKLRGPGDLSGTQQSGVLNMKIADLSQDSAILVAARNEVKDLLAEDPDLNKSEHKALKFHLDQEKKGKLDWKLIS